MNCSYSSSICGPGKITIGNSCFVYKLLPSISRPDDRNDDRKEGGRDHEYEDEDEDEERRDGRRRNHEDEIDDRRDNTRKRQKDISSSHNSEDHRNTYVSKNKQTIQTKTKIG